MVPPRVKRGWVDAEVRSVGNCLQFKRLVTILGTGSVGITSQQLSRVFYLIVRVRGCLSHLSTPRQLTHRVSDVPLTPPVDFRGPHGDFT